MSKYICIKDLEFENISVKKGSMLTVRVANILNDIQKECLGFAYVLEEHFITMAEYREYRINKILND
jgi:hypothetical protein